MRFGRVAVLLSVFLAVTVTLAQGQTQPGAMTSSETVSGSERFVPRWEISLGGGVGATRGFIKVGEFDRPGTKLGLKSDLGVNTYEDAHLDRVDFRELREQTRDRGIGVLEALSHAPYRRLLGG